MRKKIILIAFILLINFSSVFADMAPLDKSTESEKQKQGICFAPTAAAGILFSLSFIVFGLRFMRKREID
ncbi:MAG: hypothetical protein LUM44_03065 [Pyrinomonadaceae bacterium]|nr:hypothetical protein [Pyrinomonadaceae bacterium]